MPPIGLLQLFLICLAMFAIGALYITWPRPLPPPNPVGFN
jgi:hypothetical protein